MKIPITVLIALSLLAAGISCRQPAGQSQSEEQNQTPARQQASIDSLITLVQELKPGLGEFMVQLKYHHDRLAEAISDKDFERAAYEIDEMKETAEKVQQLHISNEKLQEPFPLFYGKYLQAPLESLAAAAQKTDLPALQTNLVALTNNCNSCHHENKMSFMKIK